VIACASGARSQIVTEDGKNQPRRERDRMIDIVDVFGLERRRLRQRDYGKQSAQDSFNV
jgi:hypothetical protein